MVIPAIGSTAKQFIEAIRLHCKEKYEAVDGTIVCKTCKLPVRVIRTYVSVHTTVFPFCGGPGDVVNPLLPFCLQCEGKPSDLMSCVHVRPESFNELLELEMFVSGVNPNSMAVVTGSPKS